MVSAETRQIRLSQEFLGLPDVAERLFPLSNPLRPSVERYAMTLETSGRLTPPVKEAVEKALLIRPKTIAIGYIAGSLTGANEPTKARYGLVSELLDEYGKLADTNIDIFFGYVPHLHGTDPIKHPNVTPEEIRDIDALWADLIADFHVNFVWPLAQGNAIEEGWGEKSMTPSVYLNPRGNKLSRLTRGMNNVARMIEYDDFSIDGLAQLRVFFDEFAAWLGTFPGRDPREFYYLSPKVLRGPSLRVRGLVPDRFNPIFLNDNFYVYISNPSHSRYGQVGQLVTHDWHESGRLFVKFGSRTEIFSDYSKDISFWLK